MSAKWLKSIPLFMTKMAENPTFRGRTYLYSTYKRVTSPPGFDQPFVGRTRGFGVDVAQ